MDVTLPSTSKKDTNYLVLSKPPEEVKDQQTKVEDIEERFERYEIKLAEDVKQDLEAKLWYQIWDWKNSRSALQVKLRDLNDLYEGVVRVTDFPWPGSSQLHVPIPKIKAREIRSPALISS